ncbi:MAG: hypothetical protein KDB23_02470 [Planctomycetales bacterium]|nr:hypothetical protein [Planctomycetales bacterium]
MFTPRDLELKAVCAKVRTITDQQLASVFYPDQKNPAKNLRRRVRKLGWTLQRVTTRRVALAEPLHASGDSPDFPRVSYLAAKRYQAAPMVPTTIIQIPGARSVRPSEITHDLMLADYYFANFHPDSEGRFICEDIAFQGNQVRADAVILNLATLEIDHVIEVIGGSYSAQKIESIWTHWESRKIPVVLA